MTTQAKQTTAFGIIAVIITLVQMFLDVLNKGNLPENSKMWIGAGAMLISIINSGWKQYFDRKIDSSTIWIQVLLFGAFISGGVMQEMGKLDFLGADIQSQLRMALTFITMAVPVVVKQINGQVPSNERWVQK
jgi:hypothetical protein